MSSENTSKHANGIANLQDEHNYGKSLLRDSLERLIHNRIAMIGIIIILLNIFVAVFADYITPYTYYEQILSDHDSAPSWVISLFPVLNARNEDWEIGEGQAVVESNQEVKTGDLLISYSDQELNATLDSRVFVTERRVTLYPPDAEIPQFTIPSDATLIIEEGARVNIGDVLFGDTISPIQGTALIVDDTLWLMPRTSWRSDLGEALVETGQVVAAGDPIITLDDSEVVAPIGGMMFVGRSSIELWVLPVERLTIPEGVDVHIRASRSAKNVVAGDMLFGDVIAPFNGIAFQSDNEMLIFREQSWEYGAGIPIVTSGDLVQEGQTLIDFTPLNVLANMNGTVILHEGQILLSPMDSVKYELETDANILVIDGQSVEVGTALFGGTTATIQGTAYVSEDAVYVLEANIGYTSQRNQYWFGADTLGRDILSRMIYGARISLSVAFIGPLIATLVGVPIGLISGYKSGWVDNLIMRIIDVFYAFPTLLLIILMMAYFRSGAFTRPGAEGTMGYYIYLADQSMGGMLFIFIGIGLTSWLGLARLTRGQVLSTRENEYIAAARAMGASQRQIIFKHILPNVLGPLIIFETLTIPAYIGYEAFLSFIGLGVNQPTPSWGQMIADGSASLSSYPFQAIFPALTLFFIMFAFNFLGDGLRDAFDPRLRGTD